MTAIAESRAAPRSDEPVPVTIVAHDVGGIGGMERHLEQLVLRLAELGHDVRVIARRCQLPSHPRVRWIRVPGPTRPFSLAYPSFFALGSILLRRHRRGIVHVTGAIVLNRADVATVHLCHRALAIQGVTRRSRQRSLAYATNAAIARWLSRAAERWCYRPRRLGALVAVSDGVAAELRRCFPSLADRVTTIPNGVDHLAFQPPDADARARVRGDLGLPPNRLMALFVGGEWGRKGLRFAIDAISRRPEWDLLVAGGGDRAWCERFAASVGVIDRVRLFGSTEDVLALYQAADAFVLPSAYEAFSLATLEAASCGLPLLATRVSGADELVQEGINGWFVRQDGGDIAARLGALAADAQVRAGMGAAARDSSLRYSWDAVAIAYAALYQRMAGSRA